MLIHLRCCYKHFSIGSLTENPLEKGGLTLAFEWIFSPMGEDRILEVGTTVFASYQITAYTIAYDFKEALKPAKPFVYAELPMIEALL